MVLIESQVECNQTVIDHTIGQLIAKMNEVGYNSQCNIDVYKRQPRHFIKLVRSKCVCFFQPTQIIGHTVLLVRHAVTICNRFNGHQSIKQWRRQNHKIYNVAIIFAKMKVNSFLMLWLSYEYIILRSVFKNQ